MVSGICGNDMYGFTSFMYESTMTEDRGALQPPTDRPAPRRAVAERIQGGLHGSRWRAHLPGGGTGRPPRLALLVGAGTVALRHAPDAPRLQVAAPALLWCDWPAGAVLAVAPGARAQALTMAEELLSEAVGLTHDTDHLRALLRTGGPLALPLDEERQADLALRMAAIEAELRRRGDGFHTALSAHLVLLAVALWRQLGAEGLIRPGAGGQHALLERFRRLLELHFRERWGPGAYAAALDLPLRRLNRICGRHLGRSPFRLINERSLREAQLRLERSAMTVAQIADELGFVDPPHFSRFFKAQTGQAPHPWRARARRREAGGAPAGGFSDWP